MMFVGARRRGPLAAAEPGRGWAAGTPPRAAAHGRHGRAALAITLLVPLGWLGCAHAPPRPATRGQTPLDSGARDASPGAVGPRAPSLAAWRVAPEADRWTLALWHLDEATGLRGADAGPHGLSGTFGLDTRTTFGRFRNGRLFARSMNSFVYVPAAPLLDFGADWSIEVWVKPDDFSPVECGVIAARWSQSVNEQSWLLGLIGYNRSLIVGAPPLPGLFSNLLNAKVPGTVAFVFQPEAAGEPRVFVSTLPIERDRWTHIAITRDGAELRIFVDGRLDAQFATEEQVRPSEAALVIGNLIDPRWLTTAQGPLRVPNRDDLYPFYAFVGAIDELRLSTASRTETLEGSGR